jgi:hypothetical protein
MGSNRNLSATVTRYTVRVNSQALLDELIHV